MCFVVAFAEPRESATRHNAGTTQPALSSTCFSMLLHTRQFVPKSHSQLD